MNIKELFAYICCKDAGKAIDFYKEAFGATEKFRLTEPGGRIGHAGLEFGTATLMLSDEFPEYGITRPGDSAGRSSQIHIHVDNADEFIRRGVNLGATVVHEIKDQFYGERSGTIKDPFGHLWHIGHHLEEVSPAEMQRRYDEMMKTV
jgi:PhnB protein